MQVIVQETLCTEVILHLVDSEGVIGRSAPAIRKRISTAECDEAARLRDTQKQLEDVLQALQDVQCTSQTLEEQLAAATQRVEAEEARLIADTSSPPAEVTRLKAALQKDQAKNKELWQQNCQKLAQLDVTLTVKDEELE